SSAAAAKLKTKPSPCVMELAISASGVAARQIGGDLFSRKELLSGTPSIGAVEQYRFVGMLTSATSDMPDIKRVAPAAYGNAEDPSSITIGRHPCADDRFRS